MSTLEENTIESIEESYQPSSNKKLPFKAKDISDLQVSIEI